jgi:hypothetical protein
MSFVTLWVTKDMDPSPEAGRCDVPGIFVNDRGS